MLYDGDTFSRDGKQFRVTFPYDDCHGAPWDESDMHGPVTEWTRREKAPGELILSSDRGSRRYYDFQAACKIARDVWGFTSREDAAKAARADYERLRRWCNDQWHFVIVRVDLLDDDGDALDYATIGGVESDCGDYLAELAGELAGELAANYREPEYYI